MEKSISTTPPDEVAIRAVVENWARAVRARDFNGILANHSADILMFDLPGPLQSKGIEAYGKTWDLDVEDCNGYVLCFGEDWQGRSRT